ncbi:MAG: deoxyribodipyrimidine photo-lyase [Flavobacteriales bacterium]|nr:deoxyribodipyrimidine photo-lyase [Flavobacteriales bacterium]
MTKELHIVWFRRDLRLYDQAALSAALSAGVPILPLFIFDEHIIDELPRQDARITHIHQTLQLLNEQLKAYGSSLLVVKGTPEQVFEELTAAYNIGAVFLNRDYEPYAIKRDRAIEQLLATKNIAFHSCKDQVIFEQGEVTKDDGNPYTVFTPYSKKWKTQFRESMVKPFECSLSAEKFVQHQFPFPSLNELGFEPSSIPVPEVNWKELGNYADLRNLPASDSTSKLSVHLRFGTISTRDAVAKALKLGDTFLNELIWREFFMQILWHFPEAAAHNFKRKYDGIAWRNDADEFRRWCDGQTGYPIVDAGMRELNQTGFMHNRVRMITASFLCKHLLIDWKWGEAYFAEKLLDYDLALNNGNWQWVAGTGCDAAPYFRVFNPDAQTERFDPDRKYIKKWVPEVGTGSYPAPMVDHNMARKRALEVYKAGLGS